MGLFVEEFFVRELFVIEVTGKLFFDKKIPFVEKSKTKKFKVEKSKAEKSKAKKFRTKKSKAEKSEAKEGNVSRKISNFWVHSVHCIFLLLPTSL